MSSKKSMVDAKPVKAEVKSKTTPAKRKIVDEDDSAKKSKKKPKVSATKSKSKSKKVDDENEEDNEEDEDNQIEEENDDENNDDDEENINENGSDDDDNDNDSDEDEDEDDKPKKKSSTKKSSAATKKATAKSKAAIAAAKAKLKSKSKKVVKSSKSTPSSSNVDVTSKMKKLSKMERLEEARKAFKWWEAPDLPEGINWKYLEQSGMVFAPEYIPHNIPMKYDGQIVTLSTDQEEMATFYAAIPDDGPQLGNEETRGIFQKNFFDEFSTMFTATTAKTSSFSSSSSSTVTTASSVTVKVKDFSKCDFSLIKEHLEIQKNLRKAATLEEKEVKKAGKEKIQLKHAFAIIDGRLEKVGNFSMEPPGLFRGRGVHPKTGTLKTRAFPESVTLNMSNDACVPKCNLPGHSWGSIRHDPTVTWMCTWNENVQNQVKYVMLSASSTFKGKSDQDKYATAIKLKACIDDIRKDYVANIDNEDSLKRQLGVAMWVIDRLALRVGGEKGENEADTVGCCSLRREHLTFYSATGVESDNLDDDVTISSSSSSTSSTAANTAVETDSSNTDATTANYEIQLEFLGKDSMLYKQIIDFNNYGEVGRKVYTCLKRFCAGKTKDSQVFPELSPQILNKHLSSILEGLTAKVFRTYNASVTLEKELPTAESLQGLSVQEKVSRYNAANRQVAILCNHQKTVSKSAETMFENLGEKLAILKRQKAQLNEWAKKVKAGTGNKIPLKADDDSTAKLQEKLIKATEKKEKAKSNEDKLAAALEIDNLKNDLKKDQGRRFEEKHMYSKLPTAESLKTRITKWTEDIIKLELDIKNREENKEVALGTSKINYMDPRISVAWCKRCEVPIDKIFAKTLRDKFNWAMAVDLTWKFE